jgi:hypothetical protein
MASAISRRSLAFLLAACLNFTLSIAGDEADPNARFSSVAPQGYPSYLKHNSDKVHGIIMGLTVTLIFPLGAMSKKLLDRVLRPRVLFWTHVVCQTFGLALLITGFGVGVWVAILHDEVR